MIHFSCDRCRRAITEDELRFTVSIEIQVAAEDEPSDDEMLPEEMEVLHEVLDELNDEDQREYLANPLGCEPPSRVGFSEN